MELVPLKVRIGLKANGNHKFPDFNQIDPGFRDNMDWSYFVDKFGGWHYDKVAGHADDDTPNASPPGIWIGMLLVPDSFAQEAVSKFPSICSIIDEPTAETFYNNRAHMHEPAIREDREVLQAIQAKRGVGIPEDADDLAALDPDHPAVGRRRNKVKTFAGFKTQRGITIKAK